MKKILILFIILSSHNFIFTMWKKRNYPYLSKHVAEGPLRQECLCGPRGLLRRNQLQKGCEHVEYMLAEHDKEQSSRHGWLFDGWLGELFRMGNVSAMKKAIRDILPDEDEDTLKEEYEKVSDAANSIKEEREKRLEIYKAEDKEEDDKVQGEK